MSYSKKTHELIRQNEQIVKKSQKHDTNLQKNSTLYFQIGLIVCLLAAYGLLEMRFETSGTNIAALPPIEDNYKMEAPNFTPEIVKDEVATKQKVNLPTDIFEEVPDDTPDIFIDDTPKSEPWSEPIFDSGDIFVEKAPEGPENVPFITVEQVPIYPGCERQKTNEGKKQCMSDKITKLIQKKFDTDLATELGLSGKQVIRTQFTIDKKGLVTDVKVRGTHPELEKEAKRVIGFIPEMTPGKQRDKNVGVIYSLPITFKVQQ